MALFLDTAKVEEATYAEELGFIEGITSFNAETPHNKFDTLSHLVDVFDGHVFYQVSADSLEASIDEAWQAYEVRPDRVVIAMPLTLDNLSLISKLSGVDIAMTHILNPAQAYLAAEAGAHYVVSPVGQITRQADGWRILEEVTSIINKTETQALASDVHSVEQALLALRAGVHHLSLSLELVRAMGHS